MSDARGDGPSESPAEAQFPYLTTQAPTPPTPSDQLATRPRLRNRRPQRRTDRWRAVLIGAGAGAFALAVLGAYWWSDSTDRRLSSPATAQAVVQDYLQALARADASAALGFALTPPDDATLLTAAVLAEQLARSPITAVDVAPITGRPPVTPVPATYRLGGRTVTTTFEVVRQGDAWRLGQVAAEVDLGPLPLTQLPFTLNGVQLATTRPDLFPGSYTIETSDPRYAVSGGSFVVDGPAAAPQVAAQLVLSESGRAEVAAAVRAKLASCVRQHDLKPAGCGLSVAHPRGVKLKPSTMRWSVTPQAQAALANLDVTLDRPGSASAPLRLEVHGTVQGTDGSHWEADVLLTQLRADLTGDQVSVQFG